jgi:signal transduction histidine kinase
MQTTTKYKDKTNTGHLRPRELEAVYAISHAVATDQTIESALEDITKIARPVFIFDTILLYLPSASDLLEPVYAKVIGRGQSSDGDLAWGEAIANHVFTTAQTLLRQEEQEGWQTNRLKQRFFLGLPLRLGETTMGVLVFGRFGGPPYTTEQINLAEFIAVHIAQLLGHKQLVDQIAKLEAERRLDRLQHDFIATVSHELCTPLGFIKGYATTLLRDDISWDDETTREFLAYIDEEADKLRELIDNLLDSSRLQSGTLRLHFQPVRLDSLIRDICVRVNSSSESNPIILDFAKSNVRCMADPGRLAQVIDNLLSNALKYAPGSPITIYLDASLEKAFIEVKDKGPGISQEHMEHLFKRFYRVPDGNTSVRGTGLGLFICRQIIRAHGGEISVKSTLGEGTTFHVVLPLTQTKPVTSLSLEEKPT